MEELSYSGEFVNLDRIKLDVAYGNIEARSIPIYLGATGPKMLELAGEICDGVVLNYIVTPQYIREAVKLISNGAQKSGKSLEQIDRPELLVCSLSDEDPNEAIRTGKSLIAYYLGTEPHIMKASGADPDLIERVKEVVGWPATEADYRKAADLIPDDLVKSLMATGTSKQCRETVEEYVDAGVTCPILLQLMDAMVPVIDAFAIWSM